MDRRRIQSLVGGLVLIAGGVVILTLQFVPGWQEWVAGERGWPLIIIAVGGTLFVIGLAAGQPPLAVPACIVGGIGGLLYWQNATGNWQTWSYAWTLIPGFVAVGLLLSDLLEGKKHIRGDAWLLLIISLLLFAAFGSFFGGVSVLGPYWPALLIVLGVVLLVRNVVLA